jgi:branched-chain amino acid transport system ATP-binding protein
MPVIAGGHMTAKLHVDGLNAWYGQAHILYDVGFDVVQGEVMALLGRNGAGKTTIFRAIIGLVARRSGTIAFDGTDIFDLPTHAIARRGLGYVPEDRRIFSELTVEENFLVGRQPSRPGAPNWDAEKIYALFPNLAEMRKRLGGRMSGGEQQMLTIGRTLMGNPSLVLLDEPSEGLAPRIVEQMAFAIQAMKREGLAILLSEQNLHFARLISDRAVIVEKGRVRFTGTLAELEAQPEIHNAYLAV